MDRRNVGSSSGGELRADLRDKSIPLDARKKGMLHILRDKPPPERVDKKEDDRIVLLVQILSRAEWNAATMIVRQKRPNRLWQLREGIAFVERLRKMLPETALPDYMQGFFVDHRFWQL
jgi:hypothetical protein